MVAIVVVKQPVGKVYVMVEIPNPTPVTMPVLPTVATDVVPLAQLPPDEDELSIVVVPGHAVVVPVMAAGNGFTVTTNEGDVALHVLLLITTV